MSSEIESRLRPGMSLKEVLELAGVQDDLPFAENVFLPDDPNRVPKKSQIEDVNLIMSQENMRYGLFHKPGVGKSLPSQMVALYAAGLGNRVLVITLANLVDQFAASMKFWFSGCEKYFDIHTLNDTPAKRHKLYEQWDRKGWPQVLVMSYQMWLREHRSTENRGYEYLICDEAHALKNPASKTHKAVSKYLGAEGEKGLLLMTGSPIHNELKDAYAMVKLITPKVYRSKKSFERIHCVFEWTGWGEKVLTGYKNENLLQKNLYLQGRMLTTDQVLDLKRPVYQIVPVKLDKKHKSLYDRLVNERFLEVGGEIIDALQAQSLRQKCLQMVINPHLFSDKPIRNASLEMIGDLLDSIGVENEKVMIFANYQASVRTIAEKFAHFNPVLMYGKSNSKKSMKQFIEDPKCRIVVVHPESGGAGVDGFQNVSNYIICAEPVSVPGLFEQMVSRLRRSGQKKAVYVYILKAVGTIAPSLTRNMMEKGRVTANVTRDKKSVLAELLGQE